MKSKSHKPSPISVFHIFGPHHHRTWQILLQRLRSPLGPPILLPISLPYILMDSKLRSVVADLISLPVPTIAAVSGHASAAGFIFALSHDYVLMKRDRGFLYMSELDLKLKLSIPAWFMALIRCKIGPPMSRRDVVLRADKVTADEAVKKGIIDSAYDSAEETLEAAVDLAEKLGARKWNGDVYAQIRMDLLSDVLDEIRLSFTGSRL